MKETERRRRQFIRAHHPDRGGDASAFIAGMRAFDTEQAPWRPPPSVVVDQAPELAGPAGDRGGPASWPRQETTAGPLKRHQVMPRARSRTRSRP
jgi:hypothetical protein